MRFYREFHRKSTCRVNTLKKNTYLLSSLRLNNIEIVYVYSCTTHVIFQIENCLLYIFISTEYSQVYYVQLKPSVYIADIYWARHCRLSVRPEGILKSILRPARDHITDILCEPESILEQIICEINDHHSHNYYN